MIDKTGGVSPQPPHPDDNKPKKIQKPMKKDQPSHEATQKFLGMEVTKDQKQKIYANLCNQVVTQIKQDLKRQKKALKNMKRVSEGKPMQP